MSKHSAPALTFEGRAVGNLDPAMRGRGGTWLVGQPVASRGGKHAAVLSVRLVAGGEVLPS